MMNRRWGLLLVALSAGCASGGGSSAPGQPAPPVPAVSATIAATVSGRLVLDIGTARASAARAPSFVSPNAQSVKVIFNGLVAGVYDVSVKSPNCSFSGGTRSCAITVNAPVGNAVQAAVQLYASTDGTGGTLGSAATTTAITATGFSLAFTIVPVISSVTAVASPSYITRGMSGSASVAFTVTDPSQAVIATGAPLPATILLTTNDTTNAITLSNSSLNLVPASVTAFYNGNYKTPATVTVTVGTQLGTLTSTLATVPITIGAPTLPVARYVDQPVPSTASSPVPWQIASGPDGNLWTIEQNGKALVKMTPAGVYTKYPITTTGFPTGVAAGSDGNIWFTDGACKIGKMAPSGGAMTFVSVTYSASICMGQIAATTGGDMYFYDVGAGKITRVQLPAGTVAATYTIPTAPSFGYALAGIIVGPDGNLWFSEHAANKVGRMTPSGTFTEYNLQNNARPLGLCTGTDNKIYIAEIGNSNVPNGFAVIDPLASNVQGSLVEIAVPSANFANMTAMVLGPDGNVWLPQGKSALRIVPQPAGTPSYTQINFADNVGLDVKTAVLGPDNRIYVTGQGNSSSSGQGDQIYAFMAQ